jgi:hypothetical protein
METPGFRLEAPARNPYKKGFWPWREAGNSMFSSRKIIFG